MRKIIAAEFLTLDGVMENPSWTVPYFDDELGSIQKDLLFACEALLLGRGTYEGFADAWPERGGDPFADRMNAMPKHVASRTLREIDWNARLLGEDVASEIAALKAEPGGDLLIYGSGRLVEFLRARGLIDVYRLMVFPVVVGHGERLFREEGGASDLRLVESRTTAPGVLVVTYERTG